MIHKVFGLVAMCALSGALLGADTDWKIAGPFGGTATTIAIDPHTPQTLLAGGQDSLLFRSEDAGLTWQRLEFPPRHLGEITSILVDPNDSNHYLAGVLDAFGGSLFESLDRGVSWKAVPALNFGVRALAASKSDPTEFVAGTLSGVMLTKDSGKTWNRISDLNNLEMRGITSVAIDPANPDVIYAGTSHLPWKTTDAGKTWQSIHDGMIDDSDVFSIYVDPKNSADVYASACSGIYASANGGELWKKIAGIPNTSRRTHVIRIDPLHDNTIFAGTTTGLFTSSNAGTSWRTLNSTQVNSIVFDPAQPQVMYLAMLHAGVGKSIDSGQVIQPMNDGFVDRYISGLTHAGSELFAIEEQNGDSTGIFVSKDAGSSWTEISNPKGLIRVHLRWVAGGNSDEHSVLAANTQQVWKSVDNGASWKPVPFKVVTERTVHTTVRVPAKKGVRAHTTQVDRTVRTSKVLTLASIDGIWGAREADKDAFYVSTPLGLFKSVDLGENWMQVVLPGTAHVEAMFCGSDAADPLFAKTSEGVFVSRDSGTSWQVIETPRPAADIYEMAGNAQGNQLLAATTVGLFLSPDGGKTWQANPKGLPASTVTSVVFATDKIAYSSQYGQLYGSEDAGEHWQLLPTHLSQLVIERLWSPAKGRLYAVTSGLGILFRD